MIKYIPNILTVIRIVLIPFFALPFFYPTIYGHYSVLFGTVLFILLAVTDSIDGYVARKYNVVSDFGKYWDPLADKLLVYAAFFILVWLQWFPLWIVLVLLSREMLVTLHRSAALAKGNAIAAVTSGKIKTTIQMVTVITTLVYITNATYSFIILPNWTADVPVYLLYLTLIVTLWSGLDYFIKNKSALNKKDFFDGLIKEFLSVVGVGRFPFASGTAGSAVTVLLCYVWLHTYGVYNSVWLTIVFIIGAIAAQRSLVLFGKDDAKEIVLDEVIGQMIPLLLLPVTWKAYLLGFILFRLFDIVKPYPVCAFDRMKNGWGIMMDDVAAGVYAAIASVMLLHYVPWFSM